MKNSSYARPLVPKRMRVWRQRPTEVGSEYGDAAAGRARTGVEARETHSSRRFRRAREHRQTQGARPSVLGRAARGMRWTDLRQNAEPP